MSRNIFIPFFTSMALDRCLFISVAITFRYTLYRTCIGFLLTPWSIRFLHITSFSIKSNWVSRSINVKYSFCSLLSIDLFIISFLTMLILSLVCWFVVSKTSFKCFLISMILVETFYSTEEKRRQISL